ncbi:unnamed protein product [Diatraea saccharalis]|uniref:C2H2-type domain-containing protein n=1 Tax=Diatraea saccharalis TaxID=40085 RepID=A0A9N9R6U6_9NEOP|nr:unnamed protein product [Diatraea saccharalis]
MEEKDEIHLKLLCMACLCVGRTQHNITDEKLKRFYLDSLNEIPLCSIPIANVHVCWECKAIIKKVVAFKEQVQDSYRILQTYTTENLPEYLLTDVVRSPRLVLGTVSTLSILPSQENVAGSTSSDELKDEVKAEPDEKGSESSSNENSDYGLPSNGDVDALDVEIESLVNKAKEKKIKSRNKKRKMTRVKRTRNGLKNLDRCPLSVSLLDRPSSLAIIEDSKPLQDNMKHELEITQPSVDLNKTSENNSFENVTADPFDVEIESLVSEAKDRKKKKLDCKIKKAKKIVKRLEHGLKSSKPKKIDNQKIIVVELSYEEMLLERDKESTRESYIKAAYKCDTCLVGFNYKNSYKAHISAKHSPDSGDYICPICKTIITSVDSFTAHYKRHLRRYECSICQKRTMDMKVMKQHYYSTHEISLKEYSCEICGKVSNSIDTHRYHKDTHKARVQCTECDKTFTHRAGLMNHRLSVHELNNKFPCTICDKVFRWKTSLKRHIEKHDVKDKSSTAAYCATCGVTFSSVCSYQRHMRNSLRHVTPEQLSFMWVVLKFLRLHVVLRYVCDHCKRRFADKTKLRDHIEEKHLHKTYQCHICLKPSKNRVGLDQHIRNIHKGRPNNKMCHHCGKGFPTRLQLESHIRTHTGERPFICEFCPTTFSQQSNLYKHNRQVHSNIKTKRYTSCKKRKEDKPVDVPSDRPFDPYRPIAVLQYSPDRGYVI